jgi:hypothetical protein
VAICASVNNAMPMVNGQLTAADLRFQKPDAHSQKRANGGRSPDTSSSGMSMAPLWNAAF